jgi:hypothetical protein
MKIITLYSLLATLMVAALSAATSTILSLPDATVIAEDDKLWMVDVSEGTDVDATLEQIVSPFAADPSSNIDFDVAAWLADLNLYTVTAADAAFATAAQGATADTAQQPATTLSGYGIADAYTATAADLAFATAAQGATADTAQQPATTLSGYGITDAYTTTAADAAFATAAQGATADTAQQPATTLSGYGITDAYTATAADAAFATAAQGSTADTAQQPATTLSGYGIADAYTQTAADAVFATAAQGATADTAQQPATTLSGYGIADAYTATAADLAFATAAQGATADTAQQPATTLSGYGIADAYTATAADAAFATAAQGSTADTAQQPATTLSGYGILDAYTVTAADAAFATAAQGSTADTAQQPATTLSGYGITDAYTTTAADLAFATAAQGSTADTAQQPATTLAGYGIADAYTATAADAAFATTANLTTHVDDAANPHAVTATQVGLGNVDDTSDTDKPVSTATQTALDDAAATSSAANIAVINSKSFAGGVAFAKTDGVTSWSIPAYDHAPIGTVDFAIVFNASFTEGTVEGTKTILNPSDSPTATFGIALDRSSGGSYLDGSVRLDLDGDTHLLQAPAGTFSKDVTTVISLDRDDLARLSINGVEVDTVDISASSAVDIDQAQSDLFITRNSGWLIRDLAFFNTTLTSTQASEIYAQGVGGWLAANPEYKWGGQYPLLQSWIAITTSNEFLTNNSSGELLDVVANSSAGTAGARIRYLFAEPLIVSGNAFRVTLNVASVTGSVAFKYAQSNEASNGSTGGAAPSVSATGLQVLDFITSGSDEAFGLMALLGADESINATVEAIEVLGCLAHLPMDEGVGYQLHDQSSNHHDALLSVAGAEHLQPKQAGYIRDFNVDAYNGGAGDVELLSSSRDILPAGAIIVQSYFVNNGGGSISAGALDLKRSNRTTRDTIGDNSVIVDNSHAGILSVSATSQDMADNNIALDGPGDADATSIDVRVGYEIID